MKELDISADLEIVRKARVSKPFPNVGLWNEPLSGWEDAVSCPGIIREPWQVHKWGGGTLATCRFLMHRIARLIEETGMESVQS